MAKIAVLGYGVVGSGTVEVLYKNKESLEKKAGQELDIVVSGHLKVQVGVIQKTRNHRKMDSTQRKKQSLLKR